MQEIILNTKNLNVIEEPVDDIIVVNDQNNDLDNNTIDKSKVVGVKLGNNFMSLI
jgi:hypothetical protein